MRPLKSCERDSRAKYFGTLFAGSFVIDSVSSVQNLHTSSIFWVENNNIKNGFVASKAFSKSNEYGPGNVVVRFMIQRQVSCGIAKVTLY